MAGAHSGRVAAAAGGFGPVLVHPARDPHGREPLGDRISNTNKRIDTTNKRIDDTNDRTDGRIEETKTDLVKRIDDVKTEMRQGFDRMERLLLGMNQNQSGSG